MGLTPRKGPVRAEKARDLNAVRHLQIPGGQHASPGEEKWRDSLADGFPDGARLENPQDQENFIRWFTFLAETAYYGPSRHAQAEIQDCSALIRYAYRNALMTHSAAWHRVARLPYDPGFGDVTELTYPGWPLGRALFRTRRGPFVPADLGRGAFAEFADAATLLQYNTFRVSRDLRAARPGDLLFFHQPTQRQPYHTMLFVGKSHFQSRGTDWIVYHAGDLNGRRGELRELQAGTLLGHPDPRWRPFLGNPRFLGVYRFEILR